MSPVSGCAAQCTQKDVATCLQEGNKISNETYCLLLVCKVSESPSGGTQISCGQVAEPRNCLLNQEIAEIVASLNADANSSSKCYTPSCVNGQCGYELTEKPIDPEMPDSQCLRWACEKQDDGSWEWKYRETQLNTLCKSDNCFERVCDPVGGCIETDKCLTKSDGHTSFICVEDECKDITLFSDMWKIDIVLLDIQAKDLNMTELNSYVSSLLPVEEGENVMISIEVGEGNVVRVVIYVEKEETADNVVKVFKEGPCPFNDQCQIKTAVVVNPAGMLSKANRKEDWVSVVFASVVTMLAIVVIL